jgi:hypothetical protein
MVVDMAHEGLGRVQARRVTSVLVTYSVRNAFL